MGMAVSRKMLADCTLEEIPQHLDSLKLFCLCQVDLILLEREDEEWGTLRMRHDGHWEQASQHSAGSSGSWDGCENHWQGWELGSIFLARVKHMPKGVIYWLMLGVSRICAFWEAAFPACSFVTEGSTVSSEFLWSWEVLMITLENDRTYTLEQAAPSRQE